MPEISKRMAIHTSAATSDEGCKNIVRKMQQNDPGGEAVVITGEMYRDYHSAMKLVVKAQKAGG